MGVLSTEYPLEDRIRVGKEKIKTGTLGEATDACTIINLVDMTQYDANDTRLGIVLNSLDLAYAIDAEIPINTPVYYIELADAKAVAAEVKLIEVNTAAISAGAKAAVTTGGRITTWAYTDASVGTDTVRDVVGEAIAEIAQNGSGWVKVC